MEVKFGKPMKRMHDNSSVIQRWLERLHPSESLILLGIAFLVGLLTGAGVWLFKRLIDLSHLVFYGWLGGLLQPLGNWSSALIPVAGGLIVGLFVFFLIKEERYHGVTGIMESVALAGGRLRYQRVPTKAVASAMSIGSGASVGPEDPSVQIGASFGSMFGQKLRMSDERTRALVASGAAAGISAAFNAPIAGVFFSLEIILGQLSGEMLGVIVVASVVSAIFTQAVSGAQPAFSVPAYQFKSYIELPLYLGLGLVAGLIAALYSKLVYLFQDLFHGWQAPRWIKPAAAGIILGLVGLMLPQALGVGYETIGEILAGQNLVFGLLLALLAAKLVLTPLSLGSGFMGGLFAPSLFMGATLGGAYGLLIQRIFPTLGTAPQAFAMVGMAALLAGAVHAPLTAIILLFEMTNDYRIILPLMFSVVVSILVSQLIQRDSIYTHGMARKGIRLDRGRDVEVLQAITVAEVMHTDLLTLKETQPLKEASDLLMKTRHHGLPVVDDSGKLTGILTVQDIDRAQTNGKGSLLVGQACSHELFVTYPDEPIGTALRLMSQRDLGRLPVVAREDTHRLIGMLSRSDVIRAYDIALTRRAAVRHTAHQVRLGAINPDGVSMLEITIAPGAPCDGRLMKSVSWPHDCIIASLRRGRHVIIPRGDTLLKGGDVLVAVFDEKIRDEVIRLCTKQDEEPG
jgi:chloride channel protein, CIC family